MYQVPEQELRDLYELAKEYVLEIGFDANDDEYAALQTVATILGSEDDWDE